MSEEINTADTIQRDYPQLDPALVFAILSDFATPLAPEDERSVRDTLDSLAASAELEGDAADRQASSNIDEEQRSATHSPAGAESATVSELSSALEGSSLNDGQGASDDIAPRRPAGERFWDQSAASSTSEEGIAAQDKRSPQPQTNALDPFEFDDSINGFDDPLAFLASVFPDVDLATLETKIQTARKEATAFASHDLESLVEELLSQDLITSLIDDDSNAAQIANPPPDFEAEAQMVLSKTQKRRLKQEQKAKSSFSLTASPAAPSRRLDPMVAAAVGTPATALSRAPSTSNAWASITSHASHLSSLLHIPATRISSTYYKSSASLPLTLATLLKELAAERPFDSLPYSAELVQQFRLVLPRATPEDEIKVLLSATAGDLSDAIDLKRFIADVESEQGKVLAYSEMVTPFDPAASLETGPGHSRNSSAGSIEYTAVGPSGLPKTKPSSLAHSSSSKPYSADECYALSSEYLEKRNNAFRTAARSFQRGGVGERGAAGYWAEVGREADRERRKWAERAALAVVSERRAKHDPQTVDLHGMTLAHSLKIVEEAVNTWWASAREATKPEPLRIITGIGRHSHNQTPILLPAVTKHLDKNGWRWRYDDSPYVVGGLGPTRDARGAVKVVGLK
ncbi:uncharacterized protein JCM15063_001310 [Sporobolomyces koalae]|uniref:uncharacterized protein n=1 Tax=Sporobolomyces koalae TaxID=500713 RepID=UPI00316B2AD7